MEDDSDDRKRQSSPQPSSGGRGRGRRWSRGSASLTGGDTRGRGGRGKYSGRRGPVTSQSAAKNNGGQVTVGESPEATPKAKSSRTRRGKHRNDGRNEVANHPAATGSEHATAVESPQAPPKANSRPRRGRRNDTGRNGDASEPAVTGNGQVTAAAVTSSQSLATRSEQVTAVESTQASPNKKSRPRRGKRNKYGRIEATCEPAMTSSEQVTSVESTQASPIRKSRPRRGKRISNNGSNEATSEPAMTSTEQATFGEPPQAPPKAKSHPRRGKQGNTGRNVATSQPAVTSTEQGTIGESTQAPPEAKRRPRRGKQGNAGGDRTASQPAVTNTEQETVGESPHAPPKAKRHPRRGKRNKNGSASDNEAKEKSNTTEKEPYPAHSSYEDCVALYVKKDPLIIRGKLRVLPAKDGKAFIACDRGHLGRDVLIETPFEQNRALDGDVVFCELYPEEEGVEDVTTKLANVTLEEEQKEEEPVSTWQDDDMQRRLWNPQVAIPKPPDRPRRASVEEEKQRRGRVVHVIIPKETAGTQPSELKPSDKSYLGRAPRRIIVGRLNHVRRNSGHIVFLNPNNRSLPQFICPKDFKAPASEGKDAEYLYKAEYVYGSWKESSQRPPCTNVQKMGMSCNVEDETLALLLEFNVNHGDFPAPVLKDVDAAVESGMELDTTNDMGWRPTPEMYEGRRDFRDERIFTIDPTTAKDLDDALHVKALPDGRVEIGVHIADVSYFVQPGSAVDAEAARRATTVYLVDRTIPMLPRPLCEIACSLNENVERLAFSCVWRMNIDGSVESQSRKHDDEVWYGRSIIKSCARLDYATAQNIIEGKVATGERTDSMDESLWPASRRPRGKHTVDQVAADVRLMNRVAQARRKLRFQNGAVALNGIKLAFQIDEDGETPTLCAPYPIRDSNRLVEEDMLLANYFVAQRLITHAGGLALLRHHSPPLLDGLEQVVDVAKKGMGFELDPSSSHTLQASLSRLGRECNDELVLQCVTEMLMIPMKPAEYMAAGTMEQELWRHFALNIPFYTHFTSPIRRYADVIVHRLLQATLDGDDAIDAFPMDVNEVQSVSSHCNEKKMASKKAQDRSDRVFLALYLRRNPLRRQLGVVLSVGEKTFTVFVPSLGSSVVLFLEEHKDMLTFKPYSTNGNGERRIDLVRKNSSVNDDTRWSSIDIKVFTKLLVSCYCKETPPIDVRVMLDGPWNRQGEGSN